MSAAAAGLNRFNPDSIWHQQYRPYTAGSTDLNHPTGSTPYSTDPTSTLYGTQQYTAATAHQQQQGGITLYVVLQSALAVLGLRPRGDSPGVFGTAVLLGAALLLLLLVVAASLALKWGLDYVIGAVSAFNR
jgi:hypothetical protein